tara:strand:+ start:1036 stop:1482 length:447 start_codon:yes stop_codon:yes gene_type:complete
MDAVIPLVLTGRVHIVLTDSTGNIKIDKESDNLIVTIGKAFVASALITIPSIRFLYMAVGTSATATSIAQTALVGTELARVATTNTNPTSVTTQFVASFGAGVGTGTIEEAGLFSAASAGSMFSRYLTGTFAKGSTDTLAVTWTITVN